MNQKYMALAIEQAKLAAAAGEVPIGAVIIRDGEVIAAAHNEVEATKDPSAHAELLAMRRAAERLGDFRLTGAELYVTLEPCPMCAGAAVNARIKEIVFGAADPAKGALGSVCNLYSYDFPNRPEVYGGISETACLALLQDFFRAKRSKL